MKKLYFRGKAVELTVVNVDDEELERINEASVEVDEIRDEMNQVYSLYNILPEEGTFVDENDEEVAIEFVTIYASNIGEPLGKLYDYTFDDLAEGFAAHIDIEEWDSVQSKLVEKKHFVDNDGEVVLSDAKIKETFTNAFCAEDLEDINQLVSVISVEDGVWEIELPEEFDTDQPVAIGTHEIEYNGFQIGAFVMQYNNEKLLLDELTSELESSDTEGTEVLVMTEIEYNEEAGRLMSEEIEEASL